MNERCNVLLLALSTFPRGENGCCMKENEFLWDETGKKYRGIYQLDPVPSLLIDQLEEKKEYLDKVIILATVKTYTEKDDVEIKYLDGTTKSYNGTALDYFKETLKGRMNPDSKPEDQFVIVEINEKEIEKGICDTIEAVRRIKKDSGDIKLYLDTHGGFREIFLVAEAVISLLKIDKIDVQGIYGVEYGGKGNNRIVDGQSGFHIFDFVAGMNEFINYGRITSLNSFLKKSMGTDTEAAGKQKELIACMEKISGGIQLCNVPLFENGLNQLTDYYNKLDSQNNLVDSSYLFIFAENIREDYGVLLNKERTVIDEIKWCLRKGFYQQVLTLIESRVPGYLDNCVLKCGGKGKKRDEATEATKIFNRCIPWRYHEDQEEWRKEKMTDLNKLKWYPCKTERKENETVYLEDDSSREYVMFTVPQEKKDKLDKFLTLHIDLKNMRNYSNHALNYKSKKIKGLGDVDKMVNDYLDLLEEICS